MTHRASPEWSLLLIGLLMGFLVIICGGCSVGSQQEPAASPSEADQWQIIPLPEGLVPVDCSFVDDVSGYVLCTVATDPSNRPTAAVVLCTDDGGRTWRSLGSRLHGSSGTETERVGNYCASIFFIDSRHGWLAGRGGVLSTSDAGTTWRRRVRAAASLVYASNAYSAWAVLKAEDLRGRTRLWRMLGKDERKLETMPRGVNPNALIMSEVPRGWMAGISGSSREGMLVATADAGETWGVALQVSDGAFLDVSLVGERAAWALASLRLPETKTRVSRIYSSQNADLGPASTWKPIGCDFPAEMSDISFVDGLAGWTAGEGVFCTMDGGHSWRRQSDVSGIRRLQMIDRHHGYAVGSVHGTAGFLLVYGREN